MMLSAALPSHDQQKLAAFPDKMSRKQAAAYLTSLGHRIAEKTLRNMASNKNAGGGPAFTRTGWRSLYYARADLDGWARARATKIG